MTSSRRHQLWVGLDTPGVVRPEGTPSGLTTPGVSRPEGVPSRGCPCSSVLRVTVPLAICRLRDRVAVKTGPRHAVREVEGGAFEMTVLSAQRSDAGVYTCKIINEYGTKQCEGRLEVKGERLLSGFSWR